MGKGEMFRTGGLTKEGMGEGRRWRKCMGNPMVGGTGMCWGAARARISEHKGDEGSRTGRVTIYLGHSSI